MSITKEETNSIVKELKKQTDDLRVQLEHKLEAAMGEVHEHLDDEMEELFQMLHEEFMNISTQLGVLQRLEKLEKKMSEIDTYSKRFQS